MLNDGFFHVSGRDKFNRPIVVVCPRIIFNLKPTNEDINAAAAFGIFFIKERLLVDGKCENLLIIQDLTGLGVFNTGFKQLITAV